MFDPVFLVIDIAVLATAGAILLWRFGAMDESKGPAPAVAVNAALTAQSLTKIDENQMKNGLPAAHWEELIGPRPIKPPMFSYEAEREVYHTPVRRRTPSPARARSQRRPTMTNASSALR